MKLIYLLVFVLGLFIPTVSHAATFADVIGEIVGVINYAAPVVAGLILLTFFWGVFKYIFANTSSTEKTKGKDLIIWGLVGVFVVASIWGIINILTATLIK